MFENLLIFVAYFWEPQITECVLVWVCVFVCLCVAVRLLCYHLFTLEQFVYFWTKNLIFCLKTHWTLSKFCLFPNIFYDKIFNYSECNLWKLYSPFRIDRNCLSFFWWVANLKKNIFEILMTIWNKKYFFVAWCNCKY